MSEPKLQPQKGDPVPTVDTHKRTMLAKINNLTNAAVGAFKTSADLAAFGSQIRGIIREAVEVGVEYEKGVASSSGAPVTRPAVDTKGVTTAPSATVPEEPPEVVVVAGRQAGKTTAAKEEAKA